MSNEIQLTIYAISAAIKPVEAYALVLEEKDGTRKLPVIISSLEAESIFRSSIPTQPFRPMTHDLFLITIGKLGATLRKVIIYKVEEGIFYSLIVIEREGKIVCVDSRTSDAIALAIRTNCPIFTTEEVMSREQLNMIGETAFAVNVNAVDSDTLREAMNKAVSEEKYEQASLLRDEIKRREVHACEKKENTSTTPKE